MELKRILNLPFVQLDSLRHRYILIAVTVIFSIFFLNVFVPFNINRWSRDSGFDQFIRLSGFGIIGGVVLSISQLFIRKLFGVDHFRIWTFTLWFCGELFSMAFLFIVYQSNHGIDFIQLIKEMPDSIRYTLLSILIPYSLALLFITLNIQKSKFETLKVNTVIPVFEPKLFDFPDEKGVIRFSIAPDQILYFESADNYLIIFYLNNGKLSKQILRNTLKNIELLVAGSFMKKCHRSFMINLQKIEFVDYDKACCRIKLIGVIEPIPVSRKYYPEFKLFLKSPK